MGRHEENGLRTLVNGKVEFKRVVQSPRVQRNPWRAPHISLGLSLTNNQKRNEDYGVNNKRLEINQNAIRNLSPFDWIP